MLLHFFISQKQNYKWYSLSFHSIFHLLLFSFRFVFFIIFIKLLQLYFKVSFGFSFRAHCLQFHCFRLKIKYWFNVLVCIFLYFDFDSFWHTVRVTYYQLVITAYWILESIDWRLMISIFLYLFHFSFYLQALMQLKFRCPDYFIQLYIWIERSLFTLIRISDCKSVF